MPTINSILLAVSVLNELDAQVTQVGQIYIDQRVVDAGTQSSTGKAKRITIEIYDWKGV
jgi:hypothetical protein